MSRLSVHLLRPLWRKLQMTARRVVMIKAHSPRLAQAVDTWMPTWVKPNHVTVARSLLAIPLVQHVRAGFPGSALTCFAAGMALDFVDGALAHVRGQKSAFGAFMDPLADKILVGSALWSAWPRLPLVFSLPISLITAGAVSLTALRVIRLGQTVAESAPDADSATVKQHRHDCVAAKHAGKYKAWLEVGSVIVLFIGLGTGTTWLVWASYPLLLGASALGLASLHSQLQA